jgi:hypothetical protein
MVMGGAKWAAGRDALVPRAKADVAEMSEFFKPSRAVCP